MRVCTLKEKRAPRRASALHPEEALQEGGLWRSEEVVRQAACCLLAPPAKGWA